MHRIGPTFYIQINVKIRSRHLLEYFFCNPPTTTHVQFNKIVPKIFSGLSLLKLEGDVTSFRAPSWEKWQVEDNRKKWGVVNDLIENFFFTF